MKKYFALFAFAALAAVSCTDSLNEDKASVSSNGTVFTLKLAPITKTTVDVSGSSYDLNWSDGDKIAFLLSDDSIVESSVSVSGSKATVSVDLSGGKMITDAWYPSNGKVKLTAIPAYQSATSVDVPLELHSISGTTLNFQYIQDWAIVRVSLSSPTATRIGSAKTLSFVKLKNNNSGHAPEQIQINTSETLSDAVLTYDFVVPVAAGNTFEVIVGDSEGKEYRRKKSATTETELKKLYTLPQINDIDDTGKYIWIMDGENGPDGNLLTDNAPFSYPFRAQSDYFTTMVRGSGHWTQTAWVQDAGSFKYRFGLAFSLNVSGKGQAVNTWGTLEETKTTINGSANQVVRFPAHVGNYPIFAVKMSQLSTLGNSRTFKLDINSTTDNSTSGTNSYYGRYMPVTYSGSTTSKKTLSEDGTVGIYYFDLSGDAKFKNGSTEETEPMPNSRTLHFTTWQLQIPDVVFSETQEPLPTCDFYWAGFFNSVSELESFAAAH